MDYVNIKTRNRLAELFYELGYTTGAEIGVKEGAFSEVLLKANKGLHLYSIDMWGSRRDKAFYESAVARLKLYNCDVICMKSADAVNLFKDESLDFVYIDAAHDFDNALQDISLWSKKVRKGGIVAGHDYVRYTTRSQNIKWGVIEAVKQYTTEYGIKYYVTAADTWKSYFWVRR